MKLSLSILLLVIYQFSFAQNQVGINQPNIATSAVFEMNSDSLGLLIPRLNSIEKAQITNPAEGLLIYETTSDEFWHYSGGAWIKILSEFIGLNGIGDTDADTRIILDFTNDNDQFRFLVNGTEYFRMNSERFDFDNNGNSVMVGDSAGFNYGASADDNVYLGFASGKNGISAKRNVAIGFESLRNNIDDIDNVAIGSLAAKNGTDARRNISIGPSSLHSNLQSDQLVAIGSFALESHTTNNNTVGIGIEVLRSDITCQNIAAIGTRAISSVTNRNSIVAIGYQAGMLNDGSNSIYLGANSGTSANTANSLFIDNEVSATPLLFGDFSSTTLTVNGSAHITGNIDYVGDITDISDRRLKSKIRKEETVLKKITNLNGYRYHLKSRVSNEKEYGLIAQEVQAVFPSLTRRVNANNEFIGVSYVQFIPLLVEAEKEQFAKLKELSKAEEVLNEEIESLRKDLDLIRKKARMNNSNDAEISQLDE